MKENKIPLKAVLAAIICNVFFGSAFPAIKLGYELFSIGDGIFPKILFAGIRFFISGIIVFAVTTVKNKKFPTLKKGNFLNFTLVIVFYTFLQYIFFYIGLSNTTGASGSIINTFSVFIAVIVAHFIYPDDKLTAAKVIGAVIGFAGVLFATLANDTVGGFSFFGEGFILISATTFVVGSVFSKRATKTYDSFTVTSYNLFFGGLLLIILGLFGGADSITVSLPGIAVILYLSMVSAFGVTVWSTLIQKYPIGKVSIYNFVIPVSGTILSALFLKENIFRWEYLLALALVSVGIVTVNRRKE